MDVETTDAARQKHVSTFDVDNIGYNAIILVDADSNIVYDDDATQRELSMVAKRKDWRAKVKGLLKAELKRRDLSYADLADKLAPIGVKENQRNISNKISRGTFTAVFFVQCMEAIGVKTVHLEDE